MTSSADLARVLRIADEHRHDATALHRALHLSLLAIDELVGPDDVGEVVRAVEQALASCPCGGAALREVPRERVG